MKYLQRNKWFPNVILFLFMSLFTNLSYGELAMKPLVSSAEMAKELAETYVIHVYGKKTADLQKPYRLEENESEWVIKGKAPADAMGRPLLGGYFKIILSKKDGQVLEIIHSK